MTIFFAILGLAGCFFLLICSVAFLKAKNVFVMNHIVIINNFYAISFTILAIQFSKFSSISLIKIIILIVLNIVATILITHLVTRVALANKITPEV